MRELLLRKSKASGLDKYGLDLACVLPCSWGAGNPYAKRLGCVVVVVAVVMGARHPH